MTDHRTHDHPDRPDLPDHSSHLGAFASRSAHADELDGAIDRIIDGEESSVEWNRFVASADTHPSLWRELACGQREERLLSSAIAARVERAGRLEAVARGFGDGSSRTDQIFVLPSMPPATGALAHGGAGTRLGWALAACVAGAWIVSAGLGSRERTPASSTTIQPAAFLSPHQALDAYLELGQKSGAVVGELPGKPIIERRALEDGAGFEVIFVRQIVERGRVPAMYSFDGSNEFGTPVPVPVEGVADRRDPL